MGRAGPPPMTDRILRNPFRRAPSFERLADEELVGFVRDEDPGAFEVLYDRHATVAYSLALRVLHDADAAEDVVQDAFVSVWRRAETYHPGRGSFRSWLLSVVHNRAIDRLRTVAAATRRQNALESEFAIATAPTGTSEEGVSRVLGQSIRADIADLPDDQAEVLKLAYYGGFTHNEIAQYLEIPIGTVKSRIRLGIEHLRRCMGGSTQ